MVKEVARSYTELKNLGFKAFEKSRAFSAAKQEIFKMATGPSEVSGYLYVDYQNAVIVQDLLGHPNETVKAQALRMLQSLVPSISQQPVKHQHKGDNQEAARQLPAVLGKLKMCVARYTSTVVYAIVLFGFVHYVASVAAQFIR